MTLKIEELGSIDKHILEILYEIERLINLL